ncbi:hypothetical protein [Leminorella richardii]|uniref:hypothetical protein n=1 Tax=Leminorella richardii TaxID=158841 RepID=UPI001474BAAD|nr:hypothetical protein [Leminorella richardii]
MLGLIKEETIVVTLDYHIKKKARRFRAREKNKSDSDKNSGDKKAGTLAPALIDEQH